MNKLEEIQSRLTCDYPKNCGECDKQYHCPFTYKSFACIVRVTMKHPQYIKGKVE